MEKENKYYVPIIEEFCVGFEFYVDINGEKFKNTFGEVYSELWQINELIEIGSAYVKYLDKEDIEVLGWKSSGNENELYSIKWIENPTDRKNAIWLKKFGENRLQIIDSRHEWHVSLFYGTIKNKSELKRLMKQLGIWE